MIIDDVLATAGTLGVVCRLLERSGSGAIAAAVGYGTHGVGWSRGDRTAAGTKFEPRLASLSGYFPSVLEWLGRSRSIGLRDILKVGGDQRGGRPRYGASFATSSGGPRPCC
uniref:Apt2 n=1 Tax=Mycobacterium leprae TaxID=1769 RepID=Q49648_MYCLR|nr:apt2 [Mycobacterium leprae]